MENELILAGEPCCDVITTCETPLSEPSEHECGEPEKGYTEFVKLANVLQESVLHAWKLHLKTKKYSVHMILEEYYNEALNIVDDLIEHYQGICKCNIIDDRIPLMCIKNDDPFIYFTDLRTYIIDFLNNPNNFDERTNEIKSDIDDLLRLIDSTLYKLSSLTESTIKSFNEFVYENIK